MGRPCPAPAVFPRAAAGSPTEMQALPWSALRGSCRQVQHLQHPHPFVWFDVAPLETRDRFSPTVETDSASISCARSRPAPGPRPWAPAPGDRHSAAAARSPWAAGGSTPSHEPPRSSLGVAGGEGRRGTATAQQSAAEQTPEAQQFRFHPSINYSTSQSPRGHPARPDDWQPSDPTSPAALVTASQVCHIRTPGWALGLPIDHNTGNSCEIGICEQRLCSMQQHSNNTSPRQHKTGQQQQQVQGTCPCTAPGSRLRSVPAQGAEPLKLANRWRPLTRVSDFAESGPPHTGPACPAATPPHCTTIQHPPSAKRPPNDAGR